MRPVIAFLKSLGWPGFAGLSALVLAVAAIFIGQRWDAQAAALQSEARELRAKARPAAVVAAASAPLNVEQWQATLPSSRDRQQRLADLIEMSIRLELNGTRTEHRLSTSEGLERLRVTMPLTGRYAQVRRFIAAALEHDPALSLDAVKLRRANPTSTDVDAELQWSLHGRAAP